MAGVKVTGLRETQRALAKYGADAEELKQPMADISAKGAETARNLAPAMTGALRNSIRGNKAKAKALLRAGSAKVPYASFVEFGSVHNTAVHMLKQAAEQNEDYAIGRLNEGLNAIANKYGL